MRSTYLIALGSNQRHYQYGSPRQTVRAAMEELSALGTVTARSRVIASDPIGAASRRFANAACTLESEYDPDAMLGALKRIEIEFGRRGGMRWGDRVLDLDIVLWSGGIWRSLGASAGRNRELVVPHPEFRIRRFVLGPAAAIAPEWRDPVTGLSMRHLNARLTKRRSLPS